MPELIPVDGNGGIEHCVICGGKAVGPCARCELPVCGDCCVLTEGGAKTYAICLRCERGVGRSLRSAWLGVIGWILLPIALLFGLLVLLHWLFGPDAPPLACPTSLTSDCGHSVPRQWSPRA